MMNALFRSLLLFSVLLTVLFSQTEMPKRALIGAMLFALILI